MPLGTAIKGLSTGQVIDHLSGWYPSLSSFMAVRVGTNLHFVVLLEFFVCFYGVDTVTKTGICISD